MLCPACGTENPDDAKICSNCNYRFQFGYAYNDAQKMYIPNLSKSDTKKSKVLKYTLVSLFIVIFALIILSWLKAI
jgi:uncharacterized membrane protein YvbJ